MNAVNSCLWCSGRGDWLCDAIIAIVKGKPVTCDAPCCDHHAHVVMRALVKMTGGCRSVSVDHCPLHHDPHAPTILGAVPIHPVLGSTAEADAFRAHLHAGAVRG